MLIEVFAGSGRLASAASRQGWTVKEWDLLHGPDHDLTVPANFRALMGSIPHASWVHLGTPCTVWSVARRGITNWVKARKKE